MAACSLSQHRFSVRVFRTGQNWERARDGKGETSSISLFFHPLTWTQRLISLSLFSRSTTTTESSPYFSLTFRLVFGSHFPFARNILLLLTTVGTTRVHGEDSTRRDSRSSSESSQCKLTIGCEAMTDNETLEWLVTSRKITIQCNYQNTSLAKRYYLTTPRKDICQSVLEWTNN